MMDCLGLCSGPGAQRRGASPIGVPGPGQGSEARAGSGAGGPGGARLRVGGPGGGAGPAVAVPLGEMKSFLPILQLLHAPPQ
ncbi:unnamed protein product [Gadus morhua 'NCC']